MRSNRVRSAVATALFGAGISLLAYNAEAADARHFSFGYDQPHTTGYGIAGDIFMNKLAELSKGTLAIDQFMPGRGLEALVGRAGWASDF